MNGRVRHMVVEVAVLALCAFCASNLLTARAQGPECPPGFNWVRLSGVGCMQEDCMDIANARYSYTGQCICNDGYSGCYEPVDYANFDASKCKPFCPGSRLVRCVKAGEACPGKTATPGKVEPTRASPTALATPAPTRAPTLAATARPRPTATRSVAPASDVEELLKDLERFLAGACVPAPGKGRAAAAGAVVAALVCLWAVLQVLLGRNPEWVQSAVDEWRKRDESQEQGEGGEGEPGWRSIAELYNEDPAGFRQCQDLAWARLFNRTPPRKPRGGQNKADVWDKMQADGYQSVLEGNADDMAAAKTSLTGLKDGDIIMLGGEGGLNVKEAAHYAIVENGRIHQILNLPKSGEPDSMDLDEAITFLQPRQARSLVDGKLYNLKAYQCFKVFRRTR